MTIKDCFTAPTAAGGGAPAAASGWQQLTAADCTDHYSSGCYDAYSGTPNVTLTDNAGGYQELRTIDNVSSAANKGYKPNNVNVFWHDTGIDISDIQSVEVYIEHLGEGGSPYSGNKKPLYGFMLGTVYTTPHITNTPATPQHYVRINTWFSNGKTNYYAGITVDDEGTSAAGVTGAQHTRCYAFMPVMDATAAGGTVHRVRDVTVRPIHNSGSTHTADAGRDISVQNETSRWFEDAVSQTLKVGIQVGWLASWKTHLAGEGPNFRIHYRVNQGRAW